VQLTETVCGPEAADRMQLQLFMLPVPTADTMPPKHSKHRTGNSTVAAGQSAACHGARALQPLHANSRSGVKLQIMLPLKRLRLSQAAQFSTIVQHSATADVTVSKSATAVYETTVAIKTLHIVPTMTHPKRPGLQTRHVPGEAECASSAGEQLCLSTGACSNCSTACKSLCSSELYQCTIVDEAGLIAHRQFCRHRQSDPWSSPVQTEMCSYT